ncbi:MAG: hypothetical protein CO094_05700 [Anaerolineae bacterium CG_4_9_14_3_um_filter_57_17]|nr:hypothetical protein [bacterium]NCT19750.1 hypothetical protein [bacterium]OIO85187.1 MAG: hypothetical protein AUK01_06815 [Anaerolineae bacterium CG2_30_57_67]PJB66915.1 MAG: hypothetical protein CO094_05700 [Anaerolineae bacterium CG_4_9_14_3_um_filter_57_17]
MTHHANHVFLIGRVLQSWTFGADRLVRLSIKRPMFLPPRDGGPNDLVTVLLPDAASHGIVIEGGAEIHVSGYVRNAERETTLSSLLKKCPAGLEKTRVPQIVTEVVALQWQMIQPDPPPAK